LVNLINEFRVALMSPRRRVVPPRRCRVLLHTPRKLGNECLLEKVVDDGLDDDNPFFFGEKACSFLP
jgi:hypothetical protein